MWFPAQLKQHICSPLVCQQQCNGVVAATLSLQSFACAHLPAPAVRRSGTSRAPQPLKATPVTICQQQRFPEGFLQGLGQLPLGLIVHQLQQ